MRSIVAILVLLAGNSEAQLWCPPGAVWNYYYEPLGGEGSYSRYVYEGDTLFQGLLSQRINHQDTVILWPGAPWADTVHVDVDRYTSLQDSILLLWTGNSGTAGWDTLLRFDAVVGDRWFPPGQDSACANGMGGMMQVTSTGTFLVDGFQLRSWALTTLNDVGNPTGTYSGYIERLGYTCGPEPFPSCVSVWEVIVMLSCYSDIDMTWGSGACDISMGVTTTDSLREHDLSPNPGADHFMLTLSPGPHTITLFDATGRVALKEGTSGDRVTIGTAHLPSGIYAVRVDDGLVPGRWVKQ